MNRQPPGGPQGPYPYARDSAPPTLDDLRAFKAFQRDEIARNPGAPPATYTEWIEYKEFIEMEQAYRAEVHPGQRRVPLNSSATNSSASAAQSADATATPVDPVLLSKIDNIAQDVEKLKRRRGRDDREGGEEDKDSDEDDDAHAISRRGRGRKRPRSDGAQLLTKKGVILTPKQELVRKELKVRFCLLLKL